MNPRTTLAIALSAGLPAAAGAQEVFQVHYSWEEVLAGTITPVTNPNSIVEPGEGARIRIGTTALINGTNGVGQTTAYTAPAPGGIGTVKGLGSAVYYLVGDGNASTANGSWSQLIGPEAPFLFGATAGTVQPGGASIHGFGGAQLVPTGGTANGLNDDNRLMQGTWTPASYVNRTVSFRARSGGLGFPPTQDNSLLLAYGTATAIDPISGLPFTYDLFVGKYIGTNFGTGLNIPIAPAPSSLAVLALGPLLARPRRHGPLKACDPCHVRLNTSTPPAHPQTPSPGPAPSETPARSAL